MINRNILTATCLLGLGLGYSAPGFALEAAQQVVQWDADRAILAGTGCQKDIDAFILEAGNDVSVIFSNLGVDLSDQFAPMAARKSCLARIPARVSNGYYIGTLTQAVSFGVIKSRNSQATVGVNSTFAGYRLPALNVTVGRGRIANGEIEQASRSDDFLVHGRGFCRRNIPVMYQAQLTVAGQRGSHLESVITQVDGLDVRFEATAGYFICP